VTTEKDAVRLSGLPLPPGLDFKILRIAMQVTWNAPAFWEVVGGPAGPRRAEAVPAPRHEPGA
jgi:hypothetical protein